MSSLAQQIVGVAAKAGVAVDSGFSERLASFIGLLAKWDATVNLTGFSLNPPADEAIQRLIVEPLIAAPLIPKQVQAVLDVGSGGGSPALPLKLLRPEIRFVLVESKARKCAFLREAVRHLALDGVEVFNGLLADAAKQPAVRSSMDLITIRAVKVDADVVDDTRLALKPGGQVLLFGAADAPLPLALESTSHIDVPSGRTRIVLARFR